MRCQLIRLRISLYICLRYSMVHVYNGLTMAYEVFKRTAARVDAPTVSIVPDGRMTVNAAAVRVLREYGITAVLLLWDRANHKVAIRAAGKGSKNAFAVSVSRGHSGSIRAKSFFSHIGWKAQHRERLPATWNGEERMFEITLPIKYVGSQKSGDPRTRLLGYER
jgi:hypothetical protein